MTRPLRIGLVAGEVSGDLLGAALIQALRQRRPEVQCAGVAGQQMSAAGCQSLAGVEELSVMGLAEVAMQLPRLLALRRRLLQHFLAEPPDVFIGIDAPDFNLGLERQLKRAGIRTLHWVSPSVWAWRQYRLGKIRRAVDLMLTLFPFEADFYREQGIQAEFVGHPLADMPPPAASPQAARCQLALTDAPGLALLPGSRKSEVERLLPVMLRTAVLCAAEVPGLQCLLPVATARLQPLVEKLLGRREFAALNIVTLDGQARTAMQAADVVLLASGTATLECMLLGRPMVVAYRMHPLSYALISRLLQVPYISLPNNLLGRAQIPEYLQRQATPEQLSLAVLELLCDHHAAAAQIAPFAGLRTLLRCGAADRVAARVLTLAATT